MIVATRLAAVDAQNFWMSARTAGDQFLLYTFDGAPAVEPALAALRRRASVCHDLRLRVLDTSPVRYPQWVYGAVTPEQFVVHGGVDWTTCLGAVTRLAGRSLDATSAAWRLHVFTPVAGVPTSSGPSTVVVLHISHALADGTRAAELAGWLFGRAAAVRPVPPTRRGSLVVRSLIAARGHRRLVRDTEAGLVVAAPSPRPLLLTNSAPDGARRGRIVIRHRSALGAPTVTVATLAAVGTALAGYLGERGQDVSQLAAEVPMSYSGIREAHNFFRNVGVGLYPGRSDQVDLIAADLAAARARGNHPSSRAERQAFAALPAPLLRWGVGRFDPAVRPPAVTGHTVVTSVNRGDADLQFGAAPVLFTGGLPTLSPMMSLVHGVHGIGDAVAVSVHAADSAGDIGEYVDRLEHALG